MKQTRVSFEYDRDKLPDGVSIRDVMGGVGKRAWQFMAGRFWESKDDTGPWQPLKPATWARKQSDKMLFESGAYFASWEQRQPDDYTVVISSDSRLAAWHELGTSKMPARSWIFLDDDEVEDIARWFADQVMEAFHD